MGHLLHELVDQRSGKERFGQVVGGHRWGHFRPGLLHPGGPGLLGHLPQPVVRDVHLLRRRLLVLAGGHGLAHEAADVQVLEKHHHLSFPKPSRRTICHPGTGDLAQEIQHLVPWQEPILAGCQLVLPEDQFSAELVLALADGEADAFQNALHGTPPNLMVHEVPHELLQVARVHNQVLGLMALLVLALPHVDVPLHSPVQRQVMGGLPSGRGLLNDSDLHQKAHEPLWLVHPVQRKLLANLLPGHAVLLPPEQVEELLGGAVLAGLIQRKAHLLRHLRRDGGLHERGHHLRDVHLAQGLVQVLNHVEVQILNLLLVQILNANLQGGLGVLLAAPLQRLVLRQVGPVHALGQALGVPKRLAHIRRHLHVHLLHSHVDLHKLLLQIGAVVVDILATFLPLLVF
mmetsp:Transcript_82585/g.198185  ORF Transcript_82585/g.198185 Transcript_82585/m.198185 type:complete len:402 (+) Transcript_82585:844-2049(+)